MKFLVVDDDPAILKITKKFLEINSYEVVCCDNALDAIKALSDLSFDILITDATMPAYSGFDLVRSVRKNSELEYLSIAMLTGLSEKSDIERALALGVEDYIVKPIDPAVFIEKIQRLAKRHLNKNSQKPKILDMNSEMLVPIRISRITDIGVTIESPYPLEKGTLVTIEIESLKNSGIKKNRFKAIFNTNSLHQPVQIELLLLDITPKEQVILAKLAAQWDNTKTA